MTKTQCLCGAISFQFRLTSKAITACHCQQCQRWTGGGPLYVTPVTGLNIEGKEHIAQYHASEHGERAFCKHCGTTLYWTFKNKTPAYLPVGLLDSQNELTVQEEIFIDHRPTWLSPYDNAAQSTQAQQLQLLDEYLNKTK